MKEKEEREEREERGEGGKEADFIDLGWISVSYWAGGFVGLPIEVSSLHPTEKPATKSPAPTFPSSLAHVRCLGGLAGSCHISGVWVSRSRLLCSDLSRCLCLY